MDQRNSSSPYASLLILFFLIAIFVVVMLFITNNLKQIISPSIPPTPELSLSTNIPSPLTVSVRIIETICENAEKIDYSVVELSVSGGRSPYELTITSSNLEPSGPYLILSDNLPARIKIYGGDHFTVVVRSDAGEIWSGNMGLPAEAQFCKVSATPTLEPVATEPVLEISSTPNLPNTEIITESPTATQTPTAVAGNATPTNTRKPRPTPTRTNTPAFSQPTPTASPKTPGEPDPEPTNTPRPQPTNTTGPQPTNTPRPPATNTPGPQPTNTPRPQATNTPQPQATPTAINPHPHECEDGKDNDGDGKIDMADGGCKKPSDPNE